MRGMQRVYLYAMALVSGLMLVLALANAAAILILSGMGAGAADTGTSVLGWLALIIVAAIVWGVHWWLAEREAHPLTMAGAVERAATARKAYLWAGQLCALVVLLAGVGLAIYRLVLSWLATGGTIIIPAMAAALAAIVAALIATIFWGYLRWVAAHDGDMGREAGAGPAWRHAYYYLSLTLTTLAAAAGVGAFLSVLLSAVGRYLLGVSTVSTTISWRMTLAASIAAVMVGFPATIILWVRANRLITAVTAPSEVNALSRKLVVYAARMVGAIVTMVALGYLLWQAAMLILGLAVPDVLAFWEQAVAPALAYLPVGLVLWLAFSRATYTDITRAEENQDAAILRQIYYYLMSAVGLAAFWYGLQALLVLLVLLAVGVWPASALTVPASRQYFTLTAALVLLGGPFWWGHWRFTQWLARLPGPAGHAERAAIIRRVYLYGVVIAAAVVAIITLGVVLSRAPGWLFGPTGAGNFVESVVQFGVGVGIALAMWITHAVVLRTDERLRTDDEQQGFVYGPNNPVPSSPVVSSRAAAPTTPSATITPVVPATPVPVVVRRPTTPISTVQEPLPPLAPADAVPTPRPSPVVAVVDGADGGLGAALISALRAALPEATLWPIGLNAQAYGVMSAALDGHAPPRLPADAMARVAVIVGPSDIVSPGGLNGEVPAELAAAMSSSPARKVLLPPRNPSLRWVAAPEWPQERWIEYAVNEIIGILGGA
jgi:hypothetical protein